MIPVYPASDGEEFVKIVVAMASLPVD